MKKTAYIFVVGVALVALLGVSACKKTKTVKAERKAITEAVYASGFLVPKNEYKVYALADGYITAKYKEAGDSVKKGEAILQVQNFATIANLGDYSYDYYLEKNNESYN